MNYWQLGLGLLFLLPALLGLWGMVFRPRVYGPAGMLLFAALMMLLFAALGVTLIMTVR